MPSPNEPDERGFHLELQSLKRLAELMRARVPQPPMALQLLGKVLMRAAAVGLAAGLVGSLFVAGLELVQRILLEELTGYVPLRAAGEQLMKEDSQGAFRPWLLWLIPGLGALASGLLTRLVPEAHGGGTDVVINAFHNQNAVVRRRVPLVKMLASIFTLGTGGSGGREGPTMLVGGALGSIIGRALRATPRERRILLVAGTAAGMAAVFRTPLGAALLAVEVLHRDDFESDALVPSVLASVVAYSVFISLFGEMTLFAHASTYPFYPLHLPLYAVMALVVSFFGTVFLGALRSVQRLSARVPLPGWTKPGLGGLCLGLMATTLLMSLGAHLGTGQGLGLLGGGYGAAQVAITGADWLPEGWSAVELLILLGVLKIVATALTVGTGGSAGDFGPSLVLGGIFGGAFGRAAALLFPDLHIDPGAFALVGMGTFYGGLAHVPIGSLVMVCELAGSYDLLVPLMLAEGIAFVVLRNRSLYSAQVPTKRDSAAHREDLILDVLHDVKVEQVMVRRSFIHFQRRTPATEVLQAMANADEQHTFPILGTDGKLEGVIHEEVLRIFSATPDLGSLTIAFDLMEAPVSVRQGDSLRRALELMLEHTLREVLVTDEKGRIEGFLDESEIARAYHRSTSSVAGQEPPA